jgi:hypothetical protein
MNIAAHDRVDLRNEVTRSKDRISREMRISTMSPFSNNLNGKSVCGSTPFPLIDPDLSHRKQWKDMGSKDSVHPRILQDPFINHHLSTAVPFFRGLEN